MSETIAPVLPVLQGSVAPLLPSLNASIQAAVSISDAPGTFTWTQDTPLATWTIPHNLGRKPSVTVVDSTDTEVQTGVRYVDANIIQILNASAFAGKAYLN
jgi:hypothetical protein